ncbi:MAG: L-rhamnose mutarotase [Candidatus Aminicenantes bacterium]|nr:L-rhamnose mutarotase [Candidatus Aminicenantes bacterium]
MKTRYGSLIRLKPEWEERYIILHKHVFPGVLNRIRQSNIRNYSIHLKQGLLFSYYEYRGDDYNLDMAQIQDDPVTKDWWKLTDPMQQPLESRKKGEWWALMDEVFHWENRSRSSPNERTNRIALTAKLSGYSLNQIIQPLKTSYSNLEKTFDLNDIQNFSVFKKDSCFCSYLECADKNSIKAISKIQEALSGGNNLDWLLMKEVFYTD